MARGKNRIANVAQGNGDVATLTTEDLNIQQQDDGTVTEIGGKAKKKAAPDRDAVNIEPLKEAILTIPIVGSTPLKILRFSQKKRDQVRQTQEQGDQAKTKKKREPKNFEQDYEDAKYRCTVKEDGKAMTWLGLNASGVRNGAIETCRVAGFAMTKAKMSIFCEQDGFDDLDKTPLVRILGEPEMVVDPVRNASGVIDLRPRVMFAEWRMNLRIRFDESQFSPSDVINLIIRVGRQNGLGEGRPNGTNGAGTGNGLFLVDVKNTILERLPSTPIVFEEKE